MIQQPPLKEFRRVAGSYCQWHSLVQRSAVNSCSGNGGSVEDCPGSTAWGC